MRHPISYILRVGRISVYRLHPQPFPAAISHQLQSSRTTVWTLAAIAFQELLRGGRPTRLPSCTSMLHYRPGEAAARRTSVTDAFPVVRGSTPGVPAARHLDPRH